MRMRIQSFEMQPRTWWIAVIPDIVIRLMSMSTLTLLSILITASPSLSLMLSWKTISSGNRTRLTPGWVLAKKLALLDMFQECQQLMGPIIYLPVLVNNQLPIQLRRCRAILPLRSSHSSLLVLTTPALSRLGGFLLADNWLPTSLSHPADGAQVPAARLGSSWAAADQIFSNSMISLIEPRSVWPRLLWGVRMSWRLRRQGQLSDQITQNYIPVIAGRQGRVTLLYWWTCWCWCRYYRTSVRW